mgnify:CR=1 FL=1
MPRAFELAASQPWLMLPGALDNLLTIADRMGDPAALERAVDVDLAGLVDIYASGGERELVARIGDRLELAVADGRQPSRADAIEGQHTHDGRRPRGGQLPVGRELGRLNRQVVGKALDMNGVFIGCQNFGYLLDDVEGRAIGNRIATGKQQAGAELDLDPQLVATDLELLGLNQVAKGFAHAVGNAFQ